MENVNFENDPRQNVRYSAKVLFLGPPSEFSQNVASTKFAYIVNRSLLLYFPGTLGKFAV